MLSKTYKVVGTPVNIGGNQWEVRLTDLNSNGAFKITALLIPNQEGYLSGRITEGTDNYREKDITLRILAGSDEYGSYVDASCRTTNPTFKKINELVSDDRLRDVTKSSM